MQKRDGRMKQNILIVNAVCVRSYNSVWAAILRGGLIWWQSPKANIPLGNGIHAQTQVDPEIPKWLISIANSLSKIFSNILSKKQPNI